MSATLTMPARSTGLLTRIQKPVTPEAVSPVHVHRAGTGDPLVLLHGLGESSVGGSPVIAELSAEFEVIAIDLPGFGRSPELPGGALPTAANLAVPMVLPNGSMCSSARSLSAGAPPTMMDS